MNASVTSLPVKTARKPAVPATKNAQRSQSRALRLRLRRQLYKAHAGAVIVFALLAVSLYDQAMGVSILTHAPAWECWALAIGIEVGFVSLKLDILLSATDKVRKAVKGYAMPALYATIAASGIMNAFSLSDPMHGWEKIPAAVLGLLISFLIFQISQATAHLYLGCDR